MTLHACENLSESKCIVVDPYKETSKTKESEKLCHMHSTKFIDLKWHNYTSVESNKSSICSEVSHIIFVNVFR